MSQAPAMPLFCDAYLADTMHLSNEESGCYLKLLMVTWRNNGVPLPDDDARLARTLAIGVTKWRERIRPRLVEFFDLSEGVWRQKRLEKEWKYCANRRDLNSQKGKLGGRPKSLIDNDTDEAAAFPGLKPNESPLTPTHSQQEEALTSSTESRPERASQKSLFDSINSEFEIWWEAVPRKVGKPAALKEYRTARKTTSAAVLLAGVEAFRRRVAGKDPEFIPHPRTWLHQRRWEDQDAPRAADSRSNQRSGPGFRPDFEQDEQQTKRLIERYSRKSMEVIDGGKAA